MPTQIDDDQMLREIVLRLISEVARPAGGQARRLEDRSGMPVRADLRLAELPDTAGLPGREGRPAGECPADCSAMAARWDVPM